MKLSFFVLEFLCLCLCWALKANSHVHIFFFLDSVSYITKGIVGVGGQGGVTKCPSSSTPCENSKAASIHTLVSSQ